MRSVHGDRTSPCQISIAWRAKARCSPIRCRPVPRARPTGDAADRALSHPFRSHLQFRGGQPRTACPLPGRRIRCRRLRDGTHRPVASGRGRERGRALRWRHASCDEPADPECDVIPRGRDDWAASTGRPTTSTTTASSAASTLRPSYAPEGHRESAPEPSDQTPGPGPKPRRSCAPPLDTFGGLPSGASSKSSKRVGSLGLLFARRHRLRAGRPIQGPLNLTLYPANASTAPRCGLYPRTPTRSGRMTAWRETAAHPSDFPLDVEGSQHGAFVPLFVVPLVAFVGEPWR
jgi:hypothetical protein